VKSFSSLYDGTAENDFAKSKQLQGKLDVFLAVFVIRILGHSKALAFKNALFYLPCLQ